MSCSRPAISQPNGWLTYGWLWADLVSTLRYLWYYLLDLYIQWLNSVTVVTHGPMRTLSQLKVSIKSASPLADLWLTCCSALPLYMHWWQVSHKSANRLADLRRTLGWLIVRWGLWTKILGTYYHTNKQETYEPMALCTDLQTSLIKIAKAFIGKPMNLY